MNEKQYTCENLSKEEKNANAISVHEINITRKQGTASDVMKQQ